MTRSAERLEFLWDVAITAYEGGIGYWATGTGSNYVNNDASMPTDWFIGIIDDEGTEFTLNTASIARGVNLIINGQIKISEFSRRMIKDASRSNDAGEIDAGDADMIVQSAMYGEVVYG